MTPSPRRPALVLGAILVAFAFERFAYYMFRTALASSLFHTGMTPAQLQSTYLLAALATIVGVVAGGAVLWTMGPRVTMVAGLGLAALGHFAAIGAPQVAAFVIGLAAGVVRVAPYGAIAEELEPGPARPARAVALGVAVYAAANAGAMLAAPFAEIFRHASGPAVTYGITGVVAIVGAGVGAIAFAAPRVVPDAPPPVIQPNLEAGYRGAPSVVAGAPAIPWIAVSVAVAGASLFALSHSAALDASHHVVTAERSQSFKTIEALYTINPITVIGAAAFVAAIYGYGSPARASRGLGVGLVVAGVGGALAPLLGWPGALVPTVLLATSEPLVTGVAMGVAVGRVPSRLGGVFGAGAAATLLLVATIAGRAGRALEDAPIAVVALALLTLGAGIAVLAAGRSLLEEKTE